MRGYQLSVSATGWQVIFVGKAGGYPSENGRLLASPTNIRLGWKGLPRTNTLVYYKNP